jgi:hypothetical protein
MRKLSTETNGIETAVVRLQLATIFATVESVEELIDNLIFQQNGQGCRTLKACIRAQCGTTFRQIEMSKSVLQ